MRTPVSHRRLLMWNHSIAVNALLDRGPYGHGRCGHARPCVINIVAFLPSCKIIRKPPRSAMAACTRQGRRLSLSQGPGGH